MTHTDHLRIIKFIHGWLPTNEQKCRYGASITDTCPSPECLEKETQLHIFSCKCHKQRAILGSLYMNLDKFFTKTKTTLSLRMALKNGIRHWILRLQNSTPDTTPFPQWNPNPYNTGASTPGHITAISQAYKSQSHIGWDNLLRGRLSIL